MVHGGGCAIVEERDHAVQALQDGNAAHEKTRARKTSTRLYDPPESDISADCFDGIADSDGRRSAVHRVGHFRSMKTHFGSSSNSHLVERYSEKRAVNVRFVV